LLISEAACCRCDFRLQDRIVFIEAEGRHQHFWFHLARVLDPEREVSSCIWETTRGDRAPRPNVCKVRARHAHRDGVPGDRMTADACGSRKDLFSTRCVPRESGCEPEVSWNGPVRDRVIWNLVAREDITWRPSGWRWTNSSKVRGHFLSCDP